MVFAIARPAWEPRGATRFLVAAENGRLPVAVVLNKADLVPAADAAAVVAEARALATMVWKPGYTSSIQCQGSR